MLKDQEWLIPIIICTHDREIAAKAVVLYTNTTGRVAIREAGMDPKFIEISEDDQRDYRNVIHE